MISNFAQLLIMKQFLVFFSLVFTVFLGNAQIVVNNTQTPAQLVQNVLLGFGVTATNITVNGSPLNAQNVQGNATFFDASGTTFPISTGVLLTTGNGIGAIGPNNSGSYTDNIPATPSVAGDPHLNAIANSAPTNGIVLEFDFVPSGDTISFNYIFGSDEYPEFSPSSYNDAFGFFLWGPGISGPYVLGGYPAGGTNLAIIPGTSIPVTINNLGPGAGQYPQFYQNNLNGAAFGNAIQYDGTTTALSANASVQCGQTYHIKLAISNVGDQAYDSGVFLQANSFSSEAIQVAVATVSGDTTVIEGCSTAELMFIRPQSQINDTLTINYDISGTATNGVDFPLLPNPVTFLPGQDTVTLIIDPIFDGFSDNWEYVTITTTVITVCGDTLISSGTLYIIDSVDIDIAEPDPLALCESDSILVNVSASGGEGPYTYTWDDPNSQVGPTVYLATASGTSGVTNYIVTATDACGYTGIDTVTITLNQTLMIDDILTQNASACLPNGWASATVVGVTNNGGQPYYHWTGPGNPGPNNIDGTAITNVPSGWYYFTVIDDVCQAEDSVFIDMNNPPMADFGLVADGACNPVTVNFTNESQNTVNYVWNFGDGTPNSTSTDVTHVFTNTSIVSLTASDASGCSDTAYAQIDVVLCGCTDPTAQNYNPAAQADDGSCTYPLPIIVAPNVFTPNGDNINDLFSLDATNTVNIKLVITNRWGNVMYDGDGVNPAWDGTSQGDQKASSGVYFYKYEATGVNGDMVDGHGFVHLERN